jgi:hypothetical protein
MSSAEGVFQLTPPSFPRGIIFGDTSEPLLSIYEESADQQYELGTKLVYSDGRVFRYTKNGAVALVKAKMSTAEAQTAAAVDEAQSTYGTSATVGQQEIDIDVTTGTTWTENAYAGGFLHVNDVTGEGDIYKIMANKINGSDDTLMRVLLESPIRTAWAATTEITLMKSPWRDVVVAPTSVAGVPVGVPLIAVTANYYHWGQTGGYCPMIVDASDTIVPGEPAGKPGTNGTTGAVGLVADDGTDVVYGFCVYEATGGEYALIDLKLDS